VLPASGTTPGQITVTVNPAGLAVGTYTGSIRITAADGSEVLVLVTYTITGKPAFVVTPHTLVFTTSSSTVTPNAQSLSMTSTSRAIAYNVSTQVSSPTGGTWLQVSPAQGQTAGTVTVSVNPAGLSQGVYDGTVVFTPVENGLNSVAVSVTLLVGCAEGGCLASPNIISVVNGASFHPGGAPRAIMTIFGTSLSDAIYQATSYPLPTQLGPTSVMVNGVAAPLYYVGPTQINFQMPSSAPAAAVQVVVSNPAEAGTRAVRVSQPHTSTLTAVNPGLFVTSGRRAAALNVDLSPHTAATPIPAGGYVILFLTGEGSVTPAVADGTAAPTSPLSLIDGTVQVSIGGQSAKVTYQGLAPGFAGLAQLNVIVPSGLTPGDQPVFVSVNGVPSNAGLITVK
jgi:adhesin/invasin